MVPAVADPVSCESTYARVSPDCGVAESPTTTVPNGSKDTQ